MTTTTCPCGSGRALDECCGPFLAGEADAETPEQLMRSRYSAYCTKNFDYLMETTDPQVRLEFDQEAARAWMNGSTFTSLEVMNASMNGNKGVVEFRAKFRSGEKPEEETHHEVAKFRKQGGLWYFRPR